MASESAAPVCNDDVCVMPSTKSSTPSIGVASSNATTAPPSSGIASKPVINIDIVSDNVCPWCALGKRRLEKAISQLPASAADIHIRWHPYQLDPNATKSVPKLDRYRQKFGPNVEGMLKNMVEVGKREGIDFKYSNNGKVGNTLNSHRLVEYAWEKGGEELQNKMINTIFNAYFEREQDISDIKVLAELAATVGLDKKEADEFLQTDRLESEVQKSIYSAFQKNISGVPHFTFNNKYEVSGGQDPSVFLSIFKRLGVQL